MWESILPPLVAIVLAVVFRQVVVALFAGVWLGSLLLNDFNVGVATTKLVDHYAVEALADSDHASVVLFSVMLGGMVALITRAGGASGLAEWVTKRADTPRRGLVSTWFLGMLIFFDDYANSLLVGSTMRPITDRLRVSREKLAFLVDATAAPVSSLAFVSSWIGVEVGYIADQYAALGVEVDAYWVFLQSIPYRFYPLLMLFFSLALVVSRRDFGPMYRAERRARLEGKVLAPGARPATEFDGHTADELRGIAPDVWAALLPIFVTVVIALMGMWITGSRAAYEADPNVPLTLRSVFGQANSYHALLWASAAGGASALVYAIARRRLTLAEGMDAWVSGLRSMVLAMVILVLAWTLGGMCKELGTAQWLIGVVGDNLPVWALGAVVFVVSALVSFATGTSWGTMAILFPLVIPLAHAMGGDDMQVMLGAVSSILAGSVWGDHCSPISDTTIMSSMASSCDHIDHVRTQLPYALLVGVVSLVFGDLAVGLGVYPGWVGLVVGALVLLAVLRFAGKTVPDGKTAVTA